MNQGILDDALSTIDAAIDGINSMQRKIDTLEADMGRIAKLLAVFWEQPLSISSIQPLMDLARELNPHLR